MSQSSGVLCLNRNPCDIDDPSFNLGATVMASFNGAHFPKDVILHAVFFYLRYGVSDRDLEEVMLERGVDLDRAMLNCWVGRYSVLVAESAQYRKRSTDHSWRIEETYVNVNREWVYLYRAIDKYGKTLDFMLSERRNSRDNEVFRPRACGERFTARDRHRQKRRQYRWHQSHEQDVERPWLPNPGRDGQAEILQQLH
ncbi:DDE domain-containing protein [Ruegeria halocynthiae]|uniref:DDE domain-containing protein n=1 Tax=Ruegeria halocynthiae TaxID=985054 RepID=A0A1H3ELI8_9RHOB|nr:DDE domain-containing protein [Ruegeria halocynthiae]